MYTNLSEIDYDIRDPSKNARATVKRRIRKLVDEGIIKRFTVALDGRFFEVGFSLREFCVISWNFPILFPTSMIPRDWSSSAHHRGYSPRNLQPFRGTDTPHPKVLMPHANNNKYTTPSYIFLPFSTDYHKNKTV